MRAPRQIRRTSGETEVLTRPPGRPAFPGGSVRPARSVRGRPLRCLRGRCSGRRRRAARPSAQFRGDVRQQHPGFRGGLVRCPAGAGVEQRAFLQRRTTARKRSRTASSYRPAAAASAAERRQSSALLPLPAEYRRAGPRRAGDLAVRSRTTTTTHDQQHEDEQHARDPARVHRGHAVQQLFELLAEPLPDLLEEVRLRVPVFGSVSSSAAARRAASGRCRPDVVSTSVTMPAAAAPRPRGPARCPCPRGASAGRGRRSR